MKSKVAQTLTIDAAGVYYRQLNEMIRDSVRDGARHLVIEHVNGQRYIADALSGEVLIDIHGTPGNDLGAFMDGPTVVVHGNVQDGAANTMNRGELIVHGSAGDILGYAMRGGSVFIKGRVGYRVGIHMKAYEDITPVIVAGGPAGDFLGEYMAGGVLVIGLATDIDKCSHGDWCATGMHGGAIFARGPVEEHLLGKEAGLAEPSGDELAFLEGLIERYCHLFGPPMQEVRPEQFTKIYPYSTRPYGRLYAY